MTKMRQEAKYIHRHHQQVAAGPWYRLSVWADTARPDEPKLDLMRRLVRAAGLNRVRIDEERNSAVWFTEAGRIYDAGFTLVKDGEVGEADEHYSVDLGNQPERADVERLAAVFEGPQPTEGAT